MIDTHCHIDLYKDPLSVARACENGRIRTVAVTHLPSHYLAAKKHLKSFTFVRPALGLHPLSARDHKKELALFVREAAEETLIGEIGLDFSPGLTSIKSLQEASLAAVLDCLRGKQCFITLHSRRAEDAVLKQLSQAGIEKAVFHWFSGTRAQLVRVLDAGHYVSLNAAMIETARWSEFVLLVPKDRILSESDGPFAKVGGKPALPNSSSSVVQWLSEKWSESPATVEGRLQKTFDSIAPGVFPV